MPLADEINEEFGNFCINLTKDTLSKCVSLCSEYHLTAEDLVYGWVAYSSENKRPPVTESNLELMVRAKLSGKRPSESSSANNSRIKIYTKDTIDQAPRSDLSAGSSPLSGQTGKRPLSGSQATPKRAAGTGPSRSALFSPTSYSPSGTAPSERYESRTGRGDVISSWGPELQSWTAADTAVGDVNRLGDVTLDKPYRYMFERLRERTDVLNAHILRLGELLQKRYKLEELVQPHAISQEPVYAVGRIACDGHGRLNSKSILLEGGKGDYGEGRHVELDVSQLQNAGLFTGQVVAVSGVNPTGRKFVASGIYTAVPPPAPEPVKPKHELTLVTACGPFTTSEDLLYNPLRDLLEQVTRLRPHLLLLVGPFIDTKIIENELAETYHELWNRLLELIRVAVKGSHTRVLLMPSTSDLHAEPVLPTPPFAAAAGPFTMLPNPCCFSVDGLVVGATSTDVLMHLSQQDIKLPGGGPSDRLARLAGYLIDQQSFYPLYPAEESVGLDFQHWQRHCQLPVLPHVLVTPSDFKGFVKEVSGCLVVNPSRLSRGQVGGSYARLRMPPSERDLAPEVFSAQVLKI
ncbi:DNA polymerase alpha subunit B-like [Amphibalanus amphitrite]|uniref:DNA polymerase alpha subunit B-like n=1 Tax=Amphibalanus amphitrite TaxID=1232801 RepID=UPI001C91B353|nr:DNA polymerase alpha subunit B-like [Amphibalanus amphitrite]